MSSPPVQVPSLQEILAKNPQWFGNYKVTEDDKGKSDNQFMQDLYQSLDDNFKTLLGICLDYEYGHIMWFVRDIAPAFDRYPCDYFFFYSLVVYSKLVIDPDDDTDNIIARLPYYNAFSYFLMKKGEQGVINNPNELKEQITEFAKTYNAADYPKAFASSGSTHDPLSFMNIDDNKFSEQKKPDGNSEFLKGLDSTINEIHPARSMAFTEMYKDKTEYKNFTKAIEEVMMRINANDKVFDKAVMDISETLSTMNDDQLGTFVNGMLNSMKASVGFSDDIRFSTE
jgi:hypothetical protein